MPTFPQVPPNGVIPYQVWEDKYPNPTLKDLYDRYVSVDQAVLRRKGTKFQIPDIWLWELGVLNFGRGYYEIRAIHKTEEGS